jgi:galactokinase
MGILIMLTYKEWEAWRIHGGGFAGTILAFVPANLLEEYTAYMNDIFGNHACTVLGIRAQGAMEVMIG